MKNFGRLIFILLVGFGPAGCDENILLGDYQIENVTIIDGTGNEPYVSNVTIYQGKILIHKDSSEFDVKGEVIDGTGKFLIPGLWDMHVHLAADTKDPNAPVDLVNAGVTNIRDTGGYLEDIEKLKSEIESGVKTGPNIYYVGPTLNGEVFADFQTLVATPEEGREMVRTLYAKGVDAIKIHRATSAEVLMAITETAHGLGLTVAGHIPLGNPPTLACEAGLGSVEHLGSFLEAWISVTEGEEATMAGSLNYMLSEEADPLLDCLVEARVYVTPTIIIYPYIAKSRGGEEMIELGKRTVEAMQQILTRFRKYGIPLMAGTDAPLLETGIPFGESIVEELEILQGAGYTNLELLQIATKNPATFMGVYEEVGSIDTGKRADLVLLLENPLEDISNLRTVDAVFVSGRKVK
ncbi:MAG: amidohydrolase family protein [Proteobacteria bacterium]|nr:amidohydrolase family protein [Pseudomonadota bacterium]